MKRLGGNIMKLIFAMSLLVVMGVLYYGLYRTVQNSYDRAIVARSVVDSERQNSKVAQNTADLFTRTKADRDSLDSHFVSDSNTVLFIESLEKLGADVGSSVSLSDVKADDENKLTPGSFGSISAKVEATGKWQSVMRTLMLVEVLPYQAKIDNVVLQVLHSSIQSDSDEGSEQSGTAKSSQPTWKLTLDINSTILAGSKLKK